MWSDLTLLDPWFLLLGLLAVLAVFWRLRRPRAALPIPAAVLMEGLPVTLRQRAVHLPLLLLGMGACCLSVAMARPVLRQVVAADEDALEILLALDISGSMENDDVGGGLTRLESAKRRAAEFVVGRPSDRIGLLTFAAFAELRCPPTRDHEALLAFLGAVDTVELSFENKTAIGVAVAEGTAVLSSGGAAAEANDPQRESAARVPVARVMVLLTDGMNNIGAVMPDEAAKLAADAGVRVHTIGLGRGERSLLGVQPIDFSAIEEVAEITGGLFFKADNDRALNQVYSRIDELERRPQQEERVRLDDQFVWPLGAGLLLVLLGLLVEFFWIREAP